MWNEKSYWIKRYHGRNYKSLNTRKRKDYKFEKKTPTVILSEFQKNFVSFSAHNCTRWFCRAKRTQYCPSKIIENILNIIIIIISWLLDQISTFVWPLYNFTVEKCTTKRTFSFYRITILVVRDNTRLTAFYNNHYTISFDRKHFTNNNYHRT